MVRSYSWSKLAIKNYIAFRMCDTLEPPTPILKGDQQLDKLSLEKLSLLQNAWQFVNVTPCPKCPKCCPKFYPNFKIDDLMGSASNSYQAYTIRNSFVSMTPVSFKLNNNNDLFVI